MSLLARFVRLLHGRTRPNRVSASAPLLADGPAIHFPDDPDTPQSSTSELNWQSSSLYWWGIEKQRSF